MPLNCRTDLASEARELLSDDIGEVRGIRAREETVHGHRVVAVEVLTDEGAELIGKPIGRYFTLFLDCRFERGAEQFETSAHAVAELICRCMGDVRAAFCLIAALGNPDITPDALGSLAAGSILVTRHLKRAAVDGFDAFTSTALCRTGVLGTTGVESAAQIRSLVRETQPELVIAIDALAGSELAGLCRTVQICDSGIAPGSGVGNNREELSHAGLGVPVIAVGVPTVVDAAALAPGEELRGMFVTPRDIDALVRAAGRLIGYGVDLALHPGLSVADIDMLVG